MATAKLPGTTAPDATPPEAWAPLSQLARSARRPLERFFGIEAASGILLLIASAVALTWANSGWAASYVTLWHTPLGIRIGDFRFERPLEWVVNDGLMVIFFFVVGLEIRRELHQGELSEWRRASVPAIAALGGMLAPAGIYLAFSSSPETHAGWGVPMATDIAFAVGILTLLGKRVPPALRVLLLAVAVIDDLGAILVIALFYSSGLALFGLLAAAGGFLAIRVMQRFGVRSKLAYVAPALVAWAGVYGAGIHPTIAGVIIGLLTPVQAWFGAEGFASRVEEEIGPLRNAGSRDVSSHELSNRLRQVEMASREARSPAESLIESLHPWVAFVIMPIFALANAGVALGGFTLDESSMHIALGVMVGLVVGKPIGILAAIWLMVKLRIGTLPLGIGARQLLVLGVVAGVGFTMSLFIAQLAFQNPSALAAAKLGVLGASGVAAVVALGLGRAILSFTPTVGAAQSVDEAECSTLT